jgi:tripartite-type tricarboxylate transporter receptor subunit TctC
MPAWRRATTPSKRDGQAKAEHLRFAPGEQVNEEEVAMQRMTHAVVAAALAAALGAPAAAQDYPNRPIRFIVPQSAGGSTDKVARVVAQRLTEVLGQSVVVDNRPGSGSLNGTELAARATPDGYTALVVAASLSISPAVRKTLPFDVERDFVPVTQLVDLQHLLVVHPSVPVHSVKELIAAAQAKPGELNYASSGIATSTHMAAELFRYMTHTKMTHVPYKGGGPGITAMLAGQCHLYFATISTALPHEPPRDSRRLHFLRGWGL